MNLQAVATSTPTGSFESKQNALSEKKNRTMRENNNNKEDKDKG
jgi:hypothetical protein